MTWLEPVTDGLLEQDAKAAKSAIAVAAAERRLIMMST
jgi:hypothetical protein